MKKLFFSAVALVAFSSVSMANTIAIEEENQSNFLTEVNWACVGVGFAASDAVIENGGTPQQATAAAEAAYNKCLTVVEVVKTLTLIIGN